MQECRRRTLCYFYLEKGLVWWGGKKKKFGPFLDLCVSSLRRGHANLLCIVPILSDVSEETSFNSGVSIYEETYLVLKFRCGMGMGMSRPPAAENDAVSLNLHCLYGGPQPESEGHFSCFFIWLWICSVSLLLHLFIILIFSSHRQSKENIQLYLVFYSTKLEEHIVKIWGKFMQPKNWWEKLGELRGNEKFIGFKFPSLLFLSQFPENQTTCN